ncbi:hypothetical protein [Paraburkholderia terricola]|uniref:hypothetical protein n=1 Tax=Paraburkholderia terricola TaxID=169427 RepID=UPI003ECDE4B2
MMNVTIQRRWEYDGHVKLGLSASGILLRAGDMLIGITLTDHLGDYMKRTLIAAAVAVPALAGCVTFGQMDAGMQELQGRTIETAVRVLGYPSGERLVAGMRIVHWGQRTGGLMPFTSVSQNSGSGYAGTTSFGYSGTTTTTQYMPVQYHCNIDLQISDAGLVVGGEFEGNLGGCSHYIKAMNAYRKSIGKS